MIFATVLVSSRCFVLRVLRHIILLNIIAILLRFSCRLTITVSWIELRYNPDIFVP